MCHDVRRDSFIGKRERKREKVCVGVWECGCVGVWVCGCVGVWVCDHCSRWQQGSAIGWAT